MAYMYRICVNLFKDYHNKNKQQDIPNKTYFDDLLGNASDGKTPEQLFHLKEQTLAIFRTLNPNEQKVILVDLEFKREKNHKYLPDKIIELLANQLGKKKDTIRKMRQRAIEKLKSAIHAD